MGKPRPCPYCKKRFRGKDLLRHVRTAHPKRMGRGGPSGALVAAAVVVLVIVAAAAYLLSQPQSGKPPGTTGTSVSSFGDIHGMAVNPQDPSVLIVGTHTGIVSGRNDGGWTKFGPEYDYMGFAGNPRDGNILYSSGHSGEKPNMGWMRSTDGGNTWTEIAPQLTGKDFHATTISPADPNYQFVWASDGSGLFHSTDGGFTWKQAISPGQTLALTAHPKEVHTVVAATSNGLRISKDGGQTWSVFGGSMGSLRATAISYSIVDEKVIWAFVSPGSGSLKGMVKSTDGGQTWSPSGSLSLEGGDMVAVIAPSPVDGGIVYAGTHGAAIFKSITGGASWVKVKGAG